MQVVDRCAVARFIPQAVKVSLAASTIAAPVTTCVYVVTCVSPNIGLKNGARKRIPPPITMTTPTALSKLAQEAVTAG